MKSPDRPSYPAELSRARFRPKAKTSGVALIIVLSMVTLASIILVAFLNSTSLDRSASHSYSQSLAADQIARGGCQLILADLQHEMSKDALPDTAGSAFPDQPIYTNVTGSNILPQKTGSATGIPNLVKVSGPLPTFSGTLASGTALVSSTLSSATPSRNGRFIDLNSWNMPCFGQFTAGDTIPNWLLITRNGPAASGSFGATGQTLNNAERSNPAFAIGRLAYAVYDEGGLLDVNVAGCPPTVNSTDLQKIKRTLAGAMLSGSTLPNPGDLTAWRNPASVASGTAYLDFVKTSGTSGFLKVAPNNTIFLSRQDLITAAKNGTAGLKTAMLPNLTTFTREKNSPTWGPTTPAGSSINYATAALTGTSLNPLFTVVRRPASGTVTTYHANGEREYYSVKKGEPLIKRRFPLGRLAWFELDSNGNPTNGGTAENIQACFGLIRDISQTDDGRSIHVWKYVGPSGTTEQSAIKTLAEVAAETPAREPNFFELLQAGILEGSLAVYPGPCTPFPAEAQKIRTLQVLRIGASIMDQYDSDSTPTVIEYMQGSAPWQAYGVEDLPYVNAIQPVAGVSPDNAKSLAVYVLFGFWNPHQQHTTPPTRPPVRLRVRGMFGLTNFYADASGSRYESDPFGIGYPGYNLTINNTTLELATSANNGGNGFADPHLPNVSDGSSVPNSDSTNANAITWVVTPKLGVDSRNYIGLRMPDLLMDFTKTGNSSSSIQGNITFRYSGGTNTGPAPFIATLEARNAQGEWVPYSYFSGVNDPVTWMGGIFQSVQFLRTSGSNPKIQTLPALAGAANSMWPGLALGPTFLTCDPRSLRFGFWHFKRGGAATRATEDSRLWSDQMPTLFPNGLGTPSAPIKTGYVENGPKFINETMYFPAAICRNNTAAYTTGSPVPYSSYVDRDGIRRTADNGLYPETQDYRAGNPFYRTTDRPVVLNRPFNSVAELGCTFRDNPWRSLDLFSATSPDAGLLDLFTLDDGTSDIVAGHISLNTSNSTALEAVIRGAMTDLVNNTSNVSNPSTIAANIVALTGSSPLVNKAELSTKVSPFLAAPGISVTGNFGDLDEQNVKPRREAFIRALGELGQTRTWNLMIDVIAQAGKYPKAATGLDQFVVDSQRRYWLHVAIDRFTGEVVDQKLEPVIE